MICKLCESNLIEKIAEDNNREYCHCSTCGLVFVPEKYHLNCDDEKKRYDLHDNSIDNAGYVQYLNRIVEIISELTLMENDKRNLQKPSVHIAKNIGCQSTFSKPALSSTEGHAFHQEQLRVTVPSEFYKPDLEENKHCYSINSILDFGSGKNAVLAELLKRRNYNCSAYDPAYKYEISPQNEQFDLIIICEVIEHLRNLRNELVLISKFMKKGSLILIRTQLVPSIEMFSKWWYIQDKTHINFFSYKSIQQVGHFLGCKLNFTFDKDIFVLQKTEDI